MFYCLSHRVIETCRLKNVAIFLQTIEEFVLLVQGISYLSHLFKDFFLQSGVASDFESEVFIYNA